MKQEILNEIEKNLGESPSGFELNRKLFRFGGGSNPLWAWGTVFTHTRSDYTYVKYGSWKTGQKFQYSDYNPIEYSSQFQKKHNEIVELATKDFKIVAEEKHKLCEEKWAPLFMSMPIDVKTHEYLTSKGIESNYSARVSHNTLFVPVENEGKIIGVQRIYKEEGKFVKKFASGTKMKGSYCRINNFDISKTEYVYLCEGFATGCTIFNATEVNTICAFNAGNIFELVSFLFRINPAIKIIIAADNDHETIINGEKNNVGIEKANIAKKRYPGLILRIPDFSKIENKSGLSDFNDLAQHCDNDELLNQLKFKESDFLDIALYGINDEEKFVYFTSETNRIYQLSASSHTNLNLLAIADSSYWAQRFNGRDEMGKIKWDHIIEKIMSEQRKIGPFKSTDLRGRGSWIDGELFVFNYGGGLVINNEKFSYSNHNSKNRYIAGKDIFIGEYLKTSQSVKIIDAFIKLNLKNKSDAFYIAGWIMLAQIPGFLDWRPHIWITGESGSGKTTVLKTISKLVYNQSIMQDITAAALKQILKFDSMPFIIDEAESNNKDSRRRMEQVMELIRQSSSRIGAKSARGTASGQALEYSMNSIFCLSSIQPNLPTQADVTRFTQIELLSNKGQSKEEFDKITNALEEIQSMGPELLARAIKLAPVIRENALVISNFMASEYKAELKQRQIDQISWLIAGYLALKTERIIDEYQLDELFEALDVRKSHYIESTEENETQECWEHLMSLQDRRGITIGQLIERHFTNTAFSEDTDSLAAFGIRVSSDEIIIHSRNLSILNALSKMNSQFQNYSDVLKRHERFIDRRQAKIGGQNLVCIAFKKPGRV